MKLRNYVALTEIRALEIFNSLLSQNQLWLICNFLNFFYGNTLCYGVSHLVLRNHEEKGLNCWLTNRHHRTDEVCISWVLERSSEKVKRQKMCIRNRSATSETLIGSFTMKYYSLSVSFCPLRRWTPRHWILKLLSVIEICKLKLSYPVMIRFFTFVPCYKFSFNFCRNIRACE